MEEVYCLLGVHSRIVDGGIAVTCDYGISRVLGCAVDALFGVINTMK